MESYLYTGGFTVLKIHQDRWFARSLKIFSSPNPAMFLKRALAKLIWMFLPLYYTYSFVFILKKQPGARG